MFFYRIIGALTFRPGIYKEVEKDTSFTSSAWILVTFVSFLNQLGSNASTLIVDWIAGTLAGTVFAVLGFAAGALVVSWVGRKFYHAEVTFNEMVRTLGLAYIWTIIGFLGIFVGLHPVLTCMFKPLTIAAVVALVFAWLIAAREALDLEWLPAIVTILLGLIAMLAIQFGGDVVMDAVDINADFLTGLFNW